MKTIDLVVNALSIVELFDYARQESVAVFRRTARPSFDAADELSTEFESLCRNHQFLTLLDSYKQDQRTVSLDRG